MPLSFVSLSQVIPMTKLFVGNLPFSATDASLSAHFAAHGKVESIALITDRETGRSRGFGFIEMSASDAARRALARISAAGSARGGRRRRTEAWCWCACRRVSAGLVQACCATRPHCQTIQRTSRRCVRAWAMRFPAARRSG
jgi:hypothetical protein